MFEDVFESKAEEASRLAQAPVGSLNHYLSTIPVTIEDWPMDMLIQLPTATPELGQLAVVPFAYSMNPKAEGKESEATGDKMQRYEGWFTCIVVHSTHKSYPVGGHRISVPHAELARGKKLTVSFAE